MNKIHIITVKPREEVFVKTREFWESYGWEVIPTYNDNTHPSLGRNKLLRKFYDSNDDWLCIADDDIILVSEEEFREHGSVKAIHGEINYPRLNYREFLTNNEQLFNNKTLPTCFGAVSSVNLAGRWNMVNLAKQYNNSQVFDNHWVFERSIKLAGICFIQNIKKKYDKEFFQDENIPAAEDWEFAMQLIDNGFSTALLNNIQFKENSTRTELFKGSKGTIKEAMENRKILLKEGKDLIIKKHPDASLMKNEGLQLRYWMKRAWKPQIGWTAEKKPRLLLEEI